ncbi:putative CLK4-associating serine/arginine rich protein isoform X2 [Apostichopus japonicus]|uniref:Putative CLK4-associating serine/arginine rich protein isoform X2 n=1 Tax=Stichopus japonicus TaxID=307972 RepID=A0A2G8L564_STIJA|nr:putative CLK4-associating serine/arginine rich protein isoform X2 [Apostichopus japonicus]
MWAEARRQEKKIRGIMVDFKKRAERRREYYEKIRQDPTQFLRLHGRSCKINLEQSVAEAAESPATMMPWQGDSTNMIDRFDVRAHLDMIPPMNPIKPKLTSDEEKDERRCNYERYRILVQNEYARISEEQCLKQIEVDETFPLHSKSRENQKLETKKAAIGFTYEDSTPHEPESKQDKWEEEESEESDSSLSDIDLDVEIEVAELTDEQKQQVNVMGERFGMGKTNMVRNLERERLEAEDFKRAKEEEAEKALYSGRKSRRERRALI